MTSEGTMKQRTNDQVRAAIERAFVGDENVAGDPIDVEVTSRQIRLRGTVQSFRRKIAAREIAAGLAGPRRIDDGLLVEPVLLPDEDILANVRTAFETHDGLHTGTITAMCDGGRVRLAGHAATPDQRRIAEDVALGCRGVRAVENVILVDATQELDDEAVAARIRDQLTRTAGPEADAIRIAVNRAEVVLSGTVADTRLRELAESAARQFRGWILTNEIKVSGDAPGA